MLELTLFSYFKQFLFLTVKVHINRIFFLFTEFNFGPIVFGISELNWSIFHDSHVNFRAVNMIADDMGNCLAVHFLRTCSCCPCICAKDSTTLDLQENRQILTIQLKYLEKLLIKIGKKT